MTNHLIHGAFVTGDPQIGQLAEYTPGTDRLYNYGFAMPPIIQIANRRAVDHIAERIKPGDTLIGHSNGCVIAHKAAEKAIRDGRVPSAMVFIAPAMRRDTRFIEGDYRVLCIYNPGDWVVELGRIWARLFEAETGIVHGWGAAGRLGFTTSDTRVSNFPADRGGWEQHIMPDEYIREVGPKIGRWLELN